MEKKTIKKLIFFSIIGVCIIGGLLAAWLLWPRKADPRALLTQADTLSEQNLCLTAILEEEPADEESWRALLTNYRILGADAITLKATAQAAEAAIGHAITLPEEPAAEPEEAGSILGTGGIIQGGIKLTDFENANALATDGETVYLATPDGIDAAYRGVRISLTAAKAERMMAAENGLYYLNASARRVQYIARDGHRSQTLSPIPAADFSFLEGTLYIAGTDGRLYREDTPLDTPKVTALCVAGGCLYAASEEGLLRMDEQPTVVLPSPLHAITGGEDGRIYYIDSNGYPACFDPKIGEAVILAEKTAIAIGYSEGKPYYLNQEKKIRNCS